MTNIPMALLEYVRSFPGLPVGPGDVALDNMTPDGPAVSIQINPGQRIKTYVDGTEIWKQPFTVHYRAEATQSDEEKAAMISFLNDLGTWMRRRLPEIEGFQVVGSGGVSQVGTANINEQDQSVVRYAATYQFTYEK
jgi:hypothetical protein